MKCTTCGNEIGEGYKFCGHCGTPVTSEHTTPQPTTSTEPRPIRKVPGIAKTALTLSIIGIVTLCLGIGIVFALIGVICGIVALTKINKNKTQLTGEGVAIASIVIGGAIIIFGLFFGLLAAIAIPNFMKAQERTKIARTKADEQSIATALESYFVDYSSYPMPDIDEYGTPIVPHVLTTPVGYLSSLYNFNDTFRKGECTCYGYGVDTAKGWIVRSYGPDGVDGNSGIPVGSKLDLANAWSDEALGFSLEGSGLTYDPTNGSVSPGDIWRRGP